jgi:hypothetical protein
MPSENKSSEQTLQGVFEKGLQFNGIDLLSDDPSQQKQREEALNTLVLWSGLSQVVENIAFLVAMDRLEKKRQKNKQEISFSELKEIYEKYIAPPPFTSPTAPYDPKARIEVNISSEFVSEIKKKIAEEEKRLQEGQEPMQGLEIFLNATAEVFKMFNTDTLPKVLKSEKEVNARFNKNKFSEIKNIEKRRRAIQKELDENPMPKESNADVPTGMYRSKLETELGKTKEAQREVGIKRFNSHKFYGIQNIEKRLIASTKAKKASVKLKLPAAEREIYDALLAKEHKIITKVKARFDAHKFSGKSNLVERQAAIIQAQKDSPLLKMSDAKRVIYNDLLKREYNKATTAQTGGSFVNSIRLAITKMLSPKKQVLVAGTPGAPASLEAKGASSTTVEVEPPPDLELLATLKTPPEPPMLHETLPAPPTGAPTDAPKKPPKPPKGERKNQEELKTTSERELSQQLSDVANAAKAQQKIPPESKKDGPPFTTLNDAKKDQKDRPKPAKPARDKVSATLKEVRQPTGEQTLEEKPPTKPDKPERSSAKKSM